jgi:signal transduction histidine kinase/ActR/RegA family two-component response regulator
MPVDLGISSASLFPNRPGPSTFADHAVRTSPSFSRRIVLVLSSYALMAGVLTLIGWFAHVPPLTDWANSGISMFANTAVAAACAGAALILAGMSSSWTQRLSSGLGAVVLLIGGATLFEHILGVNLGIDELLVRHSWGIKAAVAPGRMGPPASTCFTMIGMALLLLRAGPRVQRAAPVMGMLVGAISMLSLIGYLLGARPLFSLAEWTGIAFQAASILFALGLALVVSVPSSEPAWTFSQNTAAGVVARRSLPLIIALCLALGWLRVQAQDAGFVDTAMGTAMLLLTQIILFSLLLWWCVRAVASRERKQKFTEDALRESERRATTDLEATTRLYELGGQCADSNVVFEQCLNSVLETGIAITRADKGNIQLFDAESETLTIAVQQGFDESFLQFFASVRSDDATTCGAAMQCSERIVVEDVARSEIFSGRRSVGVLLEAGVHAVQSTPLVSSGGKILGIISTHFSTPHRPSERELRFMDLLARQAADFIERKQAEKRLAEQARLLEEANRLKDEFLAIMSHELRNPLNVILGYSELLVRSDEVAQSEQLHRMSEAIKRNAVVQSKLIRDLLDLSRLRSGKLVLNKETVSLMVVVNNAIDTVRGDAETKGLSIEVAAPDEAPFVEGDPLRLEQIVWNLLNNSVKFTPAGGKITVRLAKHDQYAMLSVEDTGQGIEPGFLPHAFEMFRQSYGVNTRAQSGLGIGLAVVQQLVELHGGSVDAHSEGAGKGSTFNIKLRLQSEPQAQVAPAENVAATLDQLAVLVVDDSQDTTEMLCRLLKFSGATVTAASSGEDALFLLAGDKFDVVLSDISMPGMDGFEFLRKLRQMPRLAHVPILALTGFGRPEDVERARAAGFYSHITKPFDFEALVDVLKSLPTRKDGS